MAWLWKRRREAPPSVTLPPTADQLLLNSFLELERTRLERRGDLEAKRDELEVRKLEIEMNHLEVKTKMEIEHERAREELRAIKREAGKRGMQKRRAMARPDAQGCPLCADPNYRHVTVPMVQEHNRHSALRESQPQPPLLGHVGWNGPAGGPEGEPGN